MTKTGKIWKSVAVSAVAGLAGAWAMNQFQALLESLSKPSPSQEPASEEEEEDATVKTAKALSQTLLQRDLTREEKQWAGPAVHYGMGASVGAMYGVLAETLPISQTGFGATYGAAVWAVADELAVPALGLSQPVTETPASSHMRALASHLVYGIATDLTRRGLLKLTA